MTEKELCSVFLHSTAVSDLDIFFYRKASISISVLSLGLFGDIREHWSQPRVACTPGCVTRGGKMCSRYSSVFILVLASLWDCRIFFMSAWQFFSFKSKILACTFNLCGWLIMINQFAVVVPRKSSANLVLFLISLSLICLSVLNRSYLPMQQFLLSQGLAPALESAKGPGTRVPCFWSEA